VKAALADHGDQVVEKGRPALTARRGAALKAQ